MHWHQRVMDKFQVGNNQKLIQSNPTTQPQNQKEKNHKQKLIKVHERQAW